MPKCDRCSLGNLLHIFRTPFPRNTSEWLLLDKDMKILTFQALILIHNQVHFQSAPCPVLEVGTRVPDRYTILQMWSY